MSLMIKAKLISRDEFASASQILSCTHVFWTVLEGYNEVVIFCILQLYFLICFLVLQTFLSFIFCLYSIK